MTVGMTGCTQPEGQPPLTLETLLEVVEKCRPSHAILLKDYFPIDAIYEAENPFPNEWYAKRLLLINTTTYETRLKHQFLDNGIHIPVYR